MKPADPVREDYAFQSWCKDADCTTPWDFASDTLTEEKVTLCAKWKQVYFRVTVKMEDHNGQAYNNATVTLKRGSEVIDTCTGGTAGAYVFAKHVESGIYNIVATYTDNQTEQTVTALITVSADQEVEIYLPEPGVKEALIKSGAQSRARVNLRFTLQLLRESAQELAKPTRLSAANQTIYGLAIRQTKAVCYDGKDASELCAKPLGAI